MQLHLLINVVVVLRYAFGLYLQDDRQKEHAIEMLQQLPAESNSVCTGFEKAGIGSSTAADSQALIQLKHQYCDQKRCLECGIGLQVLRPGNSLPG